MGDRSEEISVKSEADTRVVRVFISSTFKDMAEEREELVKFIFPELRRRCRERRVEFVGVDLRWGITDEEKAEGKVLPICLAEIEGCRPYFIGLLGERYGWVPEKIEDELVADQPWLAEHQDKSVTELEIWHGVLSDKEMKGLAYFYFRDTQKSLQIEEALAKEPSYAPESDNSREKLKELKDKIGTSGYPVKTDYPDAKRLGGMVLDDLWAAIDARYPFEEVPTELEQRRLEHEAFASLRTEVYIGREEYFNRLNHHVHSDGPPLVILGESGSGKSALLANWAKEYRQRHPETFLISHYIGSTADSADYVQMLRRIMEEIKNHLALGGTGAQESTRPIPTPSSPTDDDAIPSDPKKIVETFPLWLARIAAKEKLILIIDALNQLEDRDNAPDLGWLPWSLSPKVRLVVSTLPGRSLDALKKRNWPEMTIGLMERAEQERYIPAYLAKYRKSLEPFQIASIAAAPHTTNPLYLRTLLEELRVFGVYEELNCRIDHYLQAPTPDALFDLVLERLEQDYEGERLGLVREVMSLIWASRRGLAEPELLELLGQQGKPMARAIWAPLYLALEDSLVSRSGLLTFFHNFLRKAVEGRYLSDEEHKKKGHLRLADYFETKGLDDRKVDELPWQLREAESWLRLKDCVTDMDMFLQLRTDAKQYEVTGYWLALGDGYDMVEAYNEMLACYEGTFPDQPALVYRLSETAFFLNLNARYAGAEPLLRRTLAIYEKVLGPEHSKTAPSLNNLAMLLYNKGDYDGAEPLYRRALAIREKVLGPEHPDAAISLNNLAALLYKKGDYAGAEPFLRRALAIREKVLGPEHPDTAISLNSLAMLLDIRGDYAGAEPLYRTALTIFEKVLGLEHPSTATSLDSLAALLYKKGDYAGAEPFLRRALAIREKVLGPEHPDTAISLNSLAMLFDNRSDYTGAEPLYRRSLAIKEKVLGLEHPDTAISLNNLAALLDNKGDYTGAEPLYRRSLAIKEKVLGPEHPDTAISLNNLAALLDNKGDYTGAEPLYRRSLAIKEKVLGPEHPDTASSLNNLASLLYKKGDYAGAEPLYRRALVIYEKVLGPEHPDTASSLNNLAALLNNKGDYTGAEPLFRRALAIRENALATGHPDTVLSLYSVAALLDNKGDYASAEPLYRRALIGLVRVSQSIGKLHPHVQTYVNSYVGCLWQLGRKQEQIRAILDELVPGFFSVGGPEKENTEKMTPQQIRGVALEFYKNGEYDQARHLLEALLDEGFEVISTRLHLTRIAIITEQMTNARQHVRESWLHRAEGTAYIIPRILWFQLLFGLLDGTDPSPHLSYLKTALSADSAYMEWTMQPVLDHIKPSLSDHDYTLLAALVAALGDRANLPAMDQFSEWRDAKALPLEDI